MTTLAISTSSPALSLALVEGRAVLAYHHALIGRGHAEALVPAIAALIGDASITRIIVDIGPGSYTGIRIGIAAARALGLAWAVPVFGVSSVSLVAAQAFAASVQLDQVFALIDAGRGHAAGAVVGRDLVATGPALVAAVPAGMATAGAGAMLVPTALPPVHADHPDSRFAGHVPRQALGQPAALYAAD